ETVRSALGHIAGPRGVPADQSLGDDLTVLDHHTPRVADALTRVVVEADWDVLAVDGQAFEVHHDRVREAGDSHRSAGVGHHAELGHRPGLIACRLHGQRATEAEIVRLHVVGRFHGWGFRGHSRRAPLLRLCPMWA